MIDPDDLARYCKRELAATQIGEPPSLFALGYRQALEVVMAYAAFQKVKARDEARLEAETP